ncbi:hypothetical protein SLS60_002195 [Paraconiothyrium brasiliense]|uniref:Uncharacterized protein n=1 Tax=Paraconiothyrium brasiliense TaxID=300254 RepID=A0ABR3S1G7_9PLEO
MASNKPSETPQHASHRSSPTAGAPSVGSATQTTEESTDFFPSTSSAVSTTAVDTTVAANSTAQAQSSETMTAAKAKHPPADLKIKKLPSVEEIRKIIPKEGLDVRDLARKLGIDNTNYYLFSELIKITCDIEIRAWVKPLPQIPSASAVEKIYEAARKPATRRQLLANHVIDAKLTADVRISWDEHMELARGAGGILPEKFYRVFYEDSATLTPYVTKFVDLPQMKIIVLTYSTRHTHPKNRERLGVTLGENVAFQSLGKFRFKRDLTRNRIERQLAWNQKRDPSSFISVSDSIGKTMSRIATTSLKQHTVVAEKRAKFHSPSGKSNRIGERIAIAVIDTRGLRPVTIHANLEETLQKFETDAFGFENFRDIESETRQVQIPAWIHQDAITGHEDAGSMTLEELEGCDPEIWLSITELRHCNLKVPAAKGHDYEWLAAGTILKKRIHKIKPWDGEKLHHNEGPHKVRSKSSNKCWVWDWQKSTWFLDTSRVRRKSAKEQSTNNSGTCEVQVNADETGANELAASESYELDTDGEEQAHDSCSDARRNDASDGRKRKKTASDTGLSAKRSRLANTKAPTKEPACAHECSYWCPRGFGDEEARYAAAWTAVVYPENQLSIG